MDLRERKGPPWVSPWTMKQEDEEFVANYMEISVVTKFDSFFSDLKKIQCSPVLSHWYTREITLR
jgi:hypothetical protein